MLWSKLYSSSIKSGSDYSNLQKTVIILFADYELDSLKEIDKFVTKWNLREKDFPKIILTNVLEVYIIELPKLHDNDMNSELTNWVKFIKNPEVIDMNETNKQIKKAKEILEEISSDEHERYLADLREKYILDKNSLENWAREEGHRKEKMEIAKKMKNKQIDITTIIELTGLTQEEIEKL